MRRIADASLPERVLMALNFDLNDLQAFRAVAELSNFRRAAEVVNISQPALSRRIEKLEEALGVKLFDRTTRRVSLTTIGRGFSRKVDELLNELDATLLGIKGISATRIGEVTIACVPSTVYYYLSEVIRRHREKHPKIRVKVFDASANEVLAAVARNEADFGVNFIGSQEPDISFEPLLEERFVAACRRDHPLARRRRVSWEDLAGHDFITVSKTSGNRLLIDQALAGVARRPQGLYEAQHITTLIGLVEAGLGVAAVPALAMPARDHPLLVSIPLDGPEVRRVVGLIRRRGRELPPAARQLYDFFATIAPGSESATTRKPTGRKSTGRIKAPAL
jgi:DNA-binding transcriptional LysR family regulator